MASRFETIVIGTSLSEESVGVVRTGAAVARATGASPWLIHAYTLPVFPSEIMGVNREWIENQERDLRGLAMQQARCAGLAELPGFSPERLCVVAGSPQREIADLARRTRADLIVVGAAEGGAGGRLLGSTADRVARKATCPVLVVRSPLAFPPSRVEIAVDLSPVSANALRQGLDFLAGMGVPPTDAEVLFVLDPAEVSRSAHFTAEQIERFAAGELGRFIAAKAGGRARPHLTKVRTGFPRQEILTVLEERRAHLAIVGTHGRSGFERFVLGSVAARVLQQADCNVLVVPPPGRLRPDIAPGPAEDLMGADWEYVSDESPAPTPAR